MGKIAWNTPVMPPIRNVVRNPMAYSMGVSKRSDPPISVNTQLKTLTPVGTAISMVEKTKIASIVGGRPTVNM